MLHILRLVICVCAITGTLSSAYSQCARPITQYGSATASSSVGGTANSSTGIYAGSEYSTISNVVSGGNYTIDYTGIGTFITVYNSSGTPIASGTDPLTFTSTVTGTIGVAIFTNSSCGSSTNSHSFTIRTNSLPATGPCAVTIPTLSCGSSVTASLGTVSDWNVSTCFSGNGDEIVYQFTPTTTGNYRFNVTSNSAGFVNFLFKAQSGGCSNSGWTCIQNFSGTGNTNTFSLTAGVSYFILIEDESAGTGALTFSLTCPSAGPCTSIPTLTCGTSTTANLNGTSDLTISTCFTTAGDEMIYEFTPATTGSYSITFSSITGGYLNLLYKTASGGCTASGWTCVGYYNSATTTNSFTLNAGTSYYFILEKETSTTGAATFSLNCPTNPCTTTPVISCGSAVTSNFGTVSDLTVNTCFTTTGDEQIYRFTAPTTGSYTISITNATGGFVDYLFKPVSGGCSASGWTCIDDINSASTTTPFSLTAGVEYFILLEKETSTSGSQTFQINCAVNPCTTTPVINCATPVTANFGTISDITVTTCFSATGDEQIYRFTPSTTGAHTITVSSATGGFVDYLFKPVSNGCTASGWTCIDDINSASTTTPFNLTAGIEYYILLEKESSTAGSQTFSINCAVNPCASPANLTCGTSVTANLNGPSDLTVNTCFSTLGDEVIYTFTPSVTGPYQINVTGAPSGYVDFLFKAVSGGCTASGWTCIDDMNTTGLSPSFNLTAGIQYYILLEKETSAGTNITFNIQCPVDPCATIPTISACGASTSAIMGTSGIYANTCNFTTGNGQERIFQFTPTITGDHRISITNTGGSFNSVLYSFKAASGGCSSSGWSCIGTYSGTGTTATFNMTAGVTYFIMLDNASTSSSVTHTFNIVCPLVCPNGGFCMSNNAPVSTCSGVFYDNGGNSDYTSNEFFIKTFTPSTTGQMLQFAFTSFQTESGFDFLDVYDGPNTSAPFIGSYSGNSSPGTITATNPQGALTFVWDSDGSDDRAGWAANISCFTPTAPPAPSAISSTSVNVCPSSGNITLTALGADGVVYWYSGSCGGSFLGTGNSITVNPSTTTTYFARNYKFGLFSTSCASTTINVFPTPTPPTISPNGNTNFCSGNSVVLQATPTSGINWSNGSSGSNTTISTSGNYTATLTDANGCISSPSNTITVTVTPTPSAPVISANGPTTLCSNQTLTLSANVSTNLIWSDGSTNATLQPTNSGSYSAVQSINGCTSTSSNAISVQINPIPVAPVISANGATTFCSGGSVQLTSSYSTGNTWSNAASTDQIAVNTSGVYTATYTDNNGCTSLPSNSISVSVNALPAAPVISPTGPITTCQSIPVQLNTNYSSGLNWSNGSSNASLQPSISGQYSATFTDANGCTSASSNTVDVTINPTPNAPIISALGSATACQGQTVKLFENTGLVVDWSNGSNADTLFVTNSNTITATVTNGFGCTSAVSNTINVVIQPNPSTPVLTANGPTTFCLGDSVLLSTTSSGALVWNDGFNGSSRYVKQSGSYALQEVANTGCTSAFSNSIVVQVNPIPTAPVISANGATTFCLGNSVQLASSYSSGNTWSNGATTDVISVSNTQTLTATYTDANGCQSLASNAIAITVNPVPAPPTLSLSGISTICQGDSIMISANGSGIIQWNDGFTGSTRYLTGAGNYEATATSLVGCTSDPSGTVQIVINALPTPPVITANGATQFCNGGSVQLQSSYSSNNSWSTGQNTDNIVVNTSGTWTSRYTDANGCTSAPSNAIAVTVFAIPSAPVISANNTAICQTDSVFLTAQGVIGTVEWSNNVQGTQQYVKNSGTYFAINRSTDGCASAPSNAISLNVQPIPATPSIQASVVNFCQGDSLQVNATGTGGTFIWSNGAVGSSIYVNNNQSLSVRVIDLNGCISLPSNTIQLSTNPLPAAPVIAASGPTSICGTGSVQLNASTGGNTIWSDGSTGSSTLITQTGTYSASVVDANGCRSANSNSIGVSIAPIPAPPIITANGNTTFCQGDSVQLAVSNYSQGLSWSNGASTASIFASQSGIYTATVTVNGCTSNASNGIVVTAQTLSAAPTVSAGGSIQFCQGGSVTLSVNQPGVITWSNGAQGSSIIVTQTGNYSATITNAGSCPSAPSNPIQVTVFNNPAAPIISANGTSVCPGSSLTLSSNYAVGNVWSDGSISQSITVSAPGTYSVTHTDANGCVSNTSSTWVVTPGTPPAAPVISIIGNAAICQGDSVQLSSSAGANTQWSTGAIGSTIYVSQASVIDALVIGSNGCVSPTSNAVTIQVNPLPTVSFTYPGATSFCLQASKIVLQGGSPAGGVYSGTGVTNGDFDPSVSGQGTHVVTYSFTDANGCSATATETFTVNGCTSTDPLETQSISLYPNPTHQGALLQWNGYNLQTLQIFDLNGKCVASLPISANQTSWFIDTQGWAAGVYSIIGQGSTPFYQKLIVTTKN